MFNRTKQNTAQSEKPQENQMVSSEKLMQAFCDCPDIVFSDVAVNANNRLRLTVVYVEGLVNQQMMDDFILKPLVQEDAFEETRSQQAVIDRIVHGAVYHNQRMLRDKLDDCLADILSPGKRPLIFDETRQAVTFELKGFEKRSIQRADENENVLKARRKRSWRFCASTRPLVRRRLQTKDLKFVRLILGRSLKRCDRYRLPRRGRRRI
jgi:hypothetical protein